MVWKNPLQNASYNGNFKAFQKKETNLFNKTRYKRYIVMKIYFNLIFHSNTKNNYWKRDIKKKKNSSRNIFCQSNDQISVDELCWLSNFWERFFLLENKIASKTTRAIQESEATAITIHIQIGNDEELEGAFLSIVGCVDEVEEGDCEEDDDEVEVDERVDWRVGFEEDEEEVAGACVVVEASPWTVITDEEDKDWACDDGICLLVFWLFWYILLDCLLFLLFESNGWRSNSLKTLLFCCWVFW